jgi:cysteine protease ATG4
VTYEKNAGISSKWVTFTNNLKFNLKSYFSADFKQVFMLGNEKIFVMGKEFSTRPALKSVYKQAKKEVKEILWVTYRKDFGPYPPSGLVTDAGWGCTLRVGQMIFLNALRRFFDLGPEEAHHLALLVEDNMESAPFRLKNIVKVSSKDLGQWFSPCEVSHCFVDLLKTFPIPGFQSIVCMDQMICIDQVVAMASGADFEEVRMFCCCLKQDFESVCDDCGKVFKNFKWKNAVLMFLPMMLGMKVIQKEYVKVFKFFMKNEFSVGVIGGKPQSALYLVGIKGDHVFVLDPHYVQTANKTFVEFKRNIGQYYCKNFVCLPISSLESSLNAGILIRNFDDFRAFIAELKTNPDVEGFISVQGETPSYKLEDIEFEEDEDGFIVF